MANYVSPGYFKIVFQHVSKLDQHFSLKPIPKTHIAGNQQFKIQQKDKYVRKCNTTCTVMIQCDQS